MSRGVCAGGGKSSLDYLFDPDQNQLLTRETRRPTTPPFALDSDGKAEDNEIKAIALGAAHSNNSRDQDPKLGKVNQSRSSVKVRSVPGGSSSLGYLFGDK